MPSFNLNKGDKFAVSKAITKFRLGLGWDASVSGKAIDVDAHVFGCVAGQKFYNDASHAITYANGALQKNSDGSFQSADGSIIHSGDCRTGAAAGDDESIVIDTTKLPQEIVELSIFLTIHEAQSRGQRFGDIQNSYARLINEDTGEEIARYDLKNEFASAISIQVGSLARKGAEWEFAAMGVGLDSQDLGAILGALS